ncbi:MerR family transcriptional regulator [Spiroplasma cantharicola]|uniref:MerR family transcriptional regulator n=1 Tax=Spiroplasma cantharicola TaxID=362837 RepID=A0A0M4K0I3_9MOLU|nr:MerR family transcriptional regulator [Spiroplasma cantharicola]ALD65950.1 MerR family transcriptional regulator [Spiroplasma cantharicola]
MDKIYLNELAKILKINESALRYYDSRGLIPKLQRDKNNYRFILEDDLAFPKTVICLKKTGMSLKEIKKYLDFVEQGDSSIKQRYEMILKQENIVLNKLKDIQEQIEFIEYKKGLYFKKLDK